MPNYGEDLSQGNSILFKAKLKNIKCEGNVGKCSSKNKYEQLRNYIKTKPTESATL